MNSEGASSEHGSGEFLGKIFNLKTVNSDVSEKQSDYSKERGRRGMRFSKANVKSKLGIGPGATYHQCFSGSNFASQYEDECPVNYSLKYSETESCKVVGKSEAIDKKKFKNFTDYAETDLDQPTNFSLKYDEKTYDEENKNSAFNYFSNPKTKFKEYTDYVETDLDQPTDFTLKYRESAEEENHFYENEEQKVSSTFGPRTASEDGVSSERLPEGYISQNETPLMFSRSSSMNSLSSFVHITQSIPDDRSSVLSDFSRMTSGIISPSELPDSPTQTAPSSPKRHKSLSSFPIKPDFLTKQSVFEDDVATYKQEGTPIEFSRATSLSSLNIDNPLKSELLVKRNPALISKEENQNTSEHIDSEHLKHQTLPEKSEPEKGKFELASVLEVDESLFADCISIDIQINSRKSKPNHGRLVPQESSNHLRQISGLSGKHSFRLRFSHENKKSYSSFEGSDDAVHTYHTEGTPVNVSHAGSHSDLSALSIPLLGVDDNSDIESFFSDHTKTVPSDKTSSLKNSVKIFNGNQPMTMSMSQGVQRDIYVNDQSHVDYLRKDHQFTCKDEMATYATENSPCDISVRSSLSDLTVNVMDGTFSINRVETCEEPPPQLLSPLRNVSPQSPNSIVFEEAEDAGKRAEEQANEFLPSETVEHISDCSDRSSEVEEKSENKMEGVDGNCFISGSVHVINFDFDSIQPLTPFEEALVEECIRLGMPQRKNQKPLRRINSNINDDGKPTESEKMGECVFIKSAFDGSVNLKDKKISSHNFIPGTAKPLGLSLDNLDFDSSEPLTPFEEVLLEQCIRLGMPQKRNCKKLNGYHSVYSEEGTEVIKCNSTEQITPLETVLLEQCIRLGMPQRKFQRKEGVTSSDEPHKGLSYLTAHLNRLRLNSENELRKFDSCQCGKKHNNRRKSSICKKIKNRLDHFKMEC